MKNDYPCEQVIPVEQEPRHHVVIANEFVRALAVEIAPHECTLRHHHTRDYVMYVVGDAEIVSAPLNEEPKKVSYRDGQCELLPAGLVHVVQNLGDKPFRNIVLELMPKAAELKRGTGPGGSAKVQMKRILEEEAASVLVMNLQAGIEVEICGPAIVASPYEGKVELEETGRRTVTLHDFRDLVWLAPLSKRQLWNRGNGVARIVVFQLGASG